MARHPLSSPYDASGRRSVSKEEILTIRRIAARANPSTVHYAQSDLDAAILAAEEEQFERDVDALCEYCAGSVDNIARYAQAPTYIREMEINGWFHMPTVKGIGWRKACGASKLHAAHAARLREKE